LAAGEIRSEDVRIGFDIDYPKLEKMDTAIDKVIDGIGKIGHEFEPVNQQVGAMGRNFADTVDKMLGSNKSLKESNLEISKSLQNNSRVTTTFRDKIADLNSVTDSYTTRQVKQYRDVGSEISNLTGHVGILDRKMRDLPKETTAKVTFDTNGVRTGTENINTRLDKVDKSMDKTAKKSSRLKDIIVGSFAGNLISNGFMAITNGLHEATAAGMAYNKEQDTMKTVWTSLTTEAPKDGKNLVNFINSMSQHSIYAADTLNSMAQSFYHVHSNEKETKEWTNDFIALGSTLHMSNDALSESGEQFAKIVAGGKASSEDMAVMINRFPMFGEALQKATGKSMKQLYAMSAAGKLSAEQFTETLTYLGKKYHGSTKEAMTSFLGMSMYMKSRFSTLAGDVMKTSFNMDKKTAASMQDLLKDDMMKKYAKGISSALGLVTGAAVNAIDYLDKHKNTIIDVLGTAGDIAGVFGKQVWKSATDILFDMGEAFGLVDSKGKAAKDPLDQLDALLKGIDQHKGAIQLAAKAMVGLFAVKKATEFLKLTKEINSQLKISAALDKIGGFGDGIVSKPKGKHYASEEKGLGKKISESLSSGGTKAGRNFSVEAKKGSSSAGKTGGRHFASEVRDAGTYAGTTGGTKFTKAVRGIGWAGLGLTIGGSISGAFKDGVLTKKGAKDLWSNSGLIAGTAIGGYLGGPEGAVIGAAIGSGMVKQFSSWWNKAIPAMEKNIRGHDKKAKKNGQPSYSSLATNPYGSGAGTDFSTDTSTASTGSNGILNPSGIAGRKKSSKPKIAKLVTGFAIGGSAKKSGMSVVGENGSELLQRGKSLSVVGEHGAQIINVRAGDKVYKHSDMLAMTRGTFGRRLPGYAKGTGAAPSGKVSTTVKVKGVNDASMKNTEYKTKRSANAIGDSIVRGYSKGTKGATGKLKKLSKSSDSSFRSIKAGTGKQTDLIRKSTVADFDTMQKNAGKQVLQLKNYELKLMGEIHDGMSKATQAMVNDFGNIMGKLQPYAKKAMSGAITSLNGGITGIDSALSQFGGNKQVLKPIHYAAGSKGPIASDQLAVLNDATVGPRQELVSRGDQLLKPVGDNVAVHLQRGDEVFNGSQVERAKPFLPHFKKGTGASDSKLKSLASANSSNPAKAFNNEFTLNVKLDGSDLQKGITTASKSGAKTVGVPWTSAMFGYIESLISGGSSGGGPVLSSPGSGWHLTSGFGNRGATGGGYSSHDGNDFSGAKTVHAMQDSVVTGVGGAPSGWGGGSGIGQHVDTKGGKLSLIYQELNGKSNSGASILVHKGEHVKQGQALAQLGPSGTHVHVGASTEGLWSHGGGSTRGWLDITKLHGSFGNKSSSKKSKTSGALTKLVAKQLGKSAQKWISDNLADEAGGDMGNPGGSSVARWKPFVIKALKANHFSASSSQVAAWMRVISRESNGNPKAVNNWDSNAKAGHPSKGLVQTIGPTFESNKFKGHDNILNGYDDLLAGIHYMAAKYGRGAGAFSRVSGSQGYANGGFSRKHKMAEISEGDKLEAVVPMSREKSGRRKQLLKQINAYTGEAPVPKLSVSGSTSGRNVTVKMTNHITVQGGNSQSVGSQVESSMAKVSEQLADMIRRAIGTDQGEGGLVI